MTPLESARDWFARGFLPVPVPFRQKAPVVNGWQKLRLRAEDLPRYFNSQPQNIGILLGDDSGTADIDCDCMEAVAAAAEFAPPTGMCFGRKSKPASHYIYRSNPPVRFRKFVDPKDKSTIVELRCQKTNGSVGLQTVVPPSVHQCGEHIRFEAGADKEPGTADAVGLTRAVTRIAAAALLARHWPKEGSRHDAFLALAGILARADWNVGDAGAFHRAIYRALWGGAPDFSSCDSEVRSTFEKRSEAGVVTGFQTLAGLLPAVVLETALGWLGISKHTAAPKVQWPTIAPFVVRQATPLQADLFPGFLGDMVASVSQATETPIELSGLLGLGVVAACVARKVTVSPEPGYEEPLNIFVAVGMESGNRKTAVLRAMQQPFVEWGSREEERLQPERKRLLSERKTLEAQIEVLRKKAAKSLGDRDLVVQIAELEGALPEIPALPRLWVQDVTPEKLADMMAEQGERIALLSDEGGVFDLLAGRYSKGIPNLDLFLQAHSGSSVRVDRGSRPPVVMQHPALTVAISPQPDVLQNLSDRPGFRGRGLLARFLYGLPASPLGSRLLQPNPVPSEVAEAYRAGIESLLALRAPAPGTDGQLNTWQLRFSQDAYRSWKDFQRSIEVLMREGGKLFHLKDWASKLPGEAARIAGIMHCVSISPDDGGIIGVAVTEQALNLCVLLIDQAIAVFDLMQRDPVMEDGQRVLRWIRRQANPQFTIRDCFCAHQAHFKKVDPVYPAIRLLEQHGYVQPAPSTKVTGRPTEIYLVNPQIVEAEA
jgi:Protein of unknown function (DUF3987)/Bifunctional DNA primase/polymerase, N-terminal